MEEKKNNKKIWLIIKIILTIILLSFVIFITMPMLFPNAFEESNDNTEILFIGNKTEEIAQQRVEKAIREKLKNPNSLIINGISKNYSYLDDEGKFRSCQTQEQLKEELKEIKNNNEYTIHYKIDYSAQNGFGGMNRETLSALITIYNKENQITSGTPYIIFDK